MALLTAADVVNKEFTKTRYREGFEQDEVDDFLDEVANTIAALTAERDELAARLAELTAGGQLPAAAPVAVASPTTGATGAVAGGSLIGAATDPTPPSATSMLAMAQKLHDEYVAAGEAERDRIIDEARAKAETVLEKAETDAQERRKELDSERAELERKIDDLRRFERDYRSHLKSYLENLLGDLEHGAQKPAGLGTGTISVAGAAAASAAIASGVTPASVASASSAEDVAEPAEAEDEPAAQAEEPAAESAAAPADEAPADEAPAWPAAPSAPSVPEFPAPASAASPFAPAPGAAATSAVPEWPAHEVPGTSASSGDESGSPFSPVNPA